MIILFLFLLFSFGLMRRATAQDFSAYQKKAFIRNNEKLPYRILYPKNYDPQKKYPLIVFLHGSGQRGDDNDPLVNVQYARQYYRALIQANADVKYTEYPGVKHDSWDNAFKEPGFMEWLFSKEGIKDPAR